MYNHVNKEINQLHQHGQLHVSTSYVRQFSHSGHAIWATMSARKLVNYVNMDNYMLEKPTDTLVITNSIIFVAKTTCLF